MGNRYEPASNYAWIPWTIATGLVAGLGGYIIAVEGGRSAPPATYTTAGPAAAPPASSAASPAASIAASNVDIQLRAFRDILARDPKNVQAAVGAGNLLYDAQRYAEAIPFYQQAFALSGADINVSTDLGTALWYAGRADEALAQYQKSLAINASHAQTLFNVGIVKADGKKDYAGAIAAWQELLRTNPAYPEVLKVRSLVSDAQAKLGTR
jgi:tetratricopeptide (TPR) repeat protein